ncbi:hypothetical protein SAMN02745163_02368 [Clostridium cavendishii DSM 21758]|uniref:Uncharacterized protein n=1 Tax=Clostridium cavendishii DSM 21758 TaxID=1121302 RepID=A0A1M6LFF0_9CLOT|nr:hypothetical protein [Clostridium cavendishii]SHJ69961.1 hypothetical protein SAMN02745163_02368 [Clostridium cavendishii DSM 21758]
MILVLEIIGIIFMLTLIFVAVWGFILANQFYAQARYQNYLLEKLTQNIYLLVKKNNSLTSGTSNNSNENVNSENIEPPNSILQDDKQNP